MERKDRIDLFGATALILFALNLAFNQVVIKVTTGGFSPVFSAGLRSAGAIIVLLIWIRLRGQAWDIPRRALLGGVLSGVIFALEFTCLFIALDLTTVSRVSVIFYTMPVWMALTAHFVFAGEQLTKPKIAGLLMAMSGVALALLDRGGGAVSWAGDLLALASAFGAGLLMAMSGVALALLTAAAARSAGPEICWRWLLPLAGWRLCCVSG
jgi:drug/metabolite transporter (DMT)-like permease